MTAQKPTFQDGFTLVELLVSLALVSLMAVYALNAVSISSQMRRIARNDEHDAAIRSVMRAFQEEVSSLTPVFENGVATHGHLLFTAREGELTYVAMADGTREVGGLHSVTWKRDDEQQLVVERRLLRATAEDATRTVVLKGVERLAFTFDGNQSDWRNEQSLPHNIIMLLTLSGDPIRIEQVKASIVATQ